MESWPERGQFHWHRRQAQPRQVHLAPQQTEHHSSTGTTPTTGLLVAVILRGRRSAVPFGVLWRRPLSAAGLLQAAQPFRARLDRMQADRANVQFRQWGVGSSPRSGPRAAKNARPMSVLSSPGSMNQGVTRSQRSSPRMASTEPPLPGRDHALNEVSSMPATTTGGSCRKDRLERDAGATARNRNAVRPFPWPRRRGARTRMSQLERSWNGPHPASRSDHGDPVARVPAAPWRSSGEDRG